MDGVAGSGVAGRAVLDALPRAVVVTDLDGRVVLWNAPAARLYGWDEADVLGRSVLEVLASPEGLAEARARLASVAAGRSVTGQQVVTRRDGQRLQVLTFSRPVLGPDGAVIAALTAAEGVTGLREAEQQARDLGEHLRLALQAGGLGTWRWDIVSGTTMWDERLEALFGLAPGGFDGAFDTYVSLLHPDDRDAVVRTVQDAVSSKSSYRVEHRVVWPDGTIHWIAGAGGVTIDDEGVVTGTVGCAVDVTDRVVRELERQRLATAAAEAADRERLLRERLEFLAAINDALNSSDTVHDIMVNVTRRAVPRLGDWCSIHVLTAEATSPAVEVAHVDPAMVAYARQLQERFPYDPNAPSGVAYVIRTGETLYYPDITDDVVDDLEATQDERDVIADLALRSAIAVPLVKRGRVLGALQFVMSQSSRRYTEDDVLLARAVAGRVASSLENRRLHEQQRIIAQTLQRSLLPLSLPEIPGVEIAVRYWAAGEASEVGGDFYDVFPKGPDGQWAIVIGDVCGTGPQAAALTALARHTIRDAVWHGDNPVDVLASLNRAVFRSGTGSFLTALYAVIDTAASPPELTVTSGGHPLPVHASSRGSAAIGVPGTLLGVFDTNRATPHVTSLRPGDTLVFYTDGATDLPPPHALDDAELAQLVQRATTAAVDAEAIADRIQTALDAILPFHQRDDDIALLVLHLTQP